MTTDITNIKDILRLIPQFKADGHPVTPHWVMDRKLSLRYAEQFGFEVSYVEGYFFMKKSFPEFK